jgi:hypothetical protein
MDFIVKVISGFMKTLSIFGLEPLAILFSTSTVLFAIFGSIYLLKKLNFKYKGMREISFGDPTEQVLHTLDNIQAETEEVKQYLNAKEKEDAYINTVLHQEFSDADEVSEDQSKDWNAEEWKDEDDFISESYFNHKMKNLKDEIYKKVEETLQKRDSRSDSYIATFKNSIPKTFNEVRERSEKNENSIKHMSLNVKENNQQIRSLVASNRELHQLVEKLANTLRDLESPVKIPSRDTLKIDEEWENQEVPRAVIFMDRTDHGHYEVKEVVTSFAGDMFHSLNANIDYDRTWIITENEQSFFIDQFYAFDRRQVEDKSSQYIILKKVNFSKIQSFRKNKLVNKQVTTQDIKMLSIDNNLTVESVNKIKDVLNEVINFD